MRTVKHIFFGLALAILMAVPAQALIHGSDINGGYGALPGSAAALPMDASHDLSAVLAWRGHYIDGTGYYYLGARYYAPDSGEFLSADPLGHAATLDLYSAFGGDPVNSFDADGRVATKAYDATVAAGLYAASGVADLTYNLSPSYLVGTSDNPSAYGLGLKWMAGTATDQTFTNGQTMTTQMQQTQYVKNAEATIQSQLSSTGSAPYYNFGREAKLEPASSYVPGYVNDVLGMGITPNSNPTRGFLGSFQGGATTVSMVDPETGQGIAFVSYNAFNSSSLDSGFRASPSSGGYDPINPKTLIPVSNNMFGTAGPYHTVNQTFQWTEVIYFQGPIHGYNVSLNPGGGISISPAGNANGSR